MPVKRIISLEMTMHDDYDSEERLLSYLGSQLSKGRLALILGSGISRPFGLPLWGELIKKMNRICSCRKNNVSPEAQAEYIKSRYCDNNDDKFMRVVHRALYNKKFDVSLSALRKNPTLYAIGSLIMASRRGSASAVITFNFDDVLETFLKYHGFVTRSVYDEVEWGGYYDGTCYHPHGFIPYDFDNPHSKKVVFDRLSYSKIIGNEANPWRQLLLTIMRSHTCLFIGLSGADTNLESLLAAVNDKHACHNNNTVYWGISFLNSNNEAAKSVWKERGVYPKCVSSFKRDLPQFLFRVCQIASGR